MSNDNMTLDEIFGNTQPGNRVVNAPLTEHGQLCVLAEAVLASMPDDLETRKTIMTALNPQTILAELNHRGAMIAPNQG